MAFRDEITLRIKAGNGGNGAVSFLRQKFQARGGPDGGRGGDGGDVYLVADENLNTLSHLAHKPQIRAQDGAPGGSNNMRGKNGKDVRVRVPMGTIVRIQQKAVADLDRHGQELLIAKGGIGGRGNKSFATPVNQAPRKAEPGTPGQEFVVRLELKMIADVGVVGLPNAGKSTLLSKISHARPRIASYPFTTLVPSLGVVQVSPLQSFVVADLPGLIEGAHKGVGLGVTFLKHVERTRILLHLVDVSDEALLPPDQAYAIIRKELESYSETLARKREVVVANKMDARGAKKGLELLQTVARDAIAVSAAKGRGLRELIERLAGALGLT